MSSRNRRGRQALAVCAVVVMWAVSSACGVPTWNSSLHDADLPVPDTGGDRWLKVHGHDGALWVLDAWQVPDSSGILRGTGVRYDVDRAETERGAFTIAADSIALLEANDKEVVSRFAYTALGAYTTLAGATTLICLADPKACFGSCPTFYESVAADRPLAEGFSASFARVLEARDVDHLGLTRSPGPFSLVMRNEAQETHAVRDLSLLAVPVVEGTEVLLGRDGRLHRSLHRGEAVACTSEDGDCLHEIRRSDDVELAPTADESDLARREEVVVDLGSVSGRVGLTLTARHSFVSTFVFYQSLAYGGEEVGSVLAAMERGDHGVKERVLGVSRELGGIEIFARIEDRPAVLLGTFDEAGPIAADRQLFEVGDLSGQRLEVVLRMARGSWRIDELSLAYLGDVVEPIVLTPDSVETLAREPDDALRRLADPDEYLVTTQGDAHRIWFEAPAGAEHQLFLDTRGYYYEWMRADWLAEQDPMAAASVLHDPRRALRDMAPRFKAAESRMEKLFWSSRFRR